MLRLSCCIVLLCSAPPHPSGRIRIRLHCCSSARSWQRDAWLSVSSLRPSLAPYNAAQFLPSPGEVVEVKAKSAEHEPYSWWRGSVKSVRANPAALEETDGVVDSLGSTAKALIYEIS